MHYTELRAMALALDAERAGRPAPATRPRRPLPPFLRRRAQRPAQVPPTRTPAGRLTPADACGERPPA